MQPAERLKCNGLVHGGYSWGCCQSAADAIAAPLQSLTTGSQDHQQATREWNQEWHQDIVLQQKAVLVRGRSPKLRSALGIDGSVGRKLAVVNLRQPPHSSVTAKHSAKGTAGAPADSPRAAAAAASQNAVAATAAIHRAARTRGDARKLPAWVACSKRGNTALLPSDRAAPAPPS